MRGIFGTILVISLLLISGTNQVKAGNELEPNFVDNQNDTIEYWDIISAWFFEEPNNKDILRIHLKMNEQSQYIRSIIIIRFTCGDIEYCIKSTISFFGIPYSILTTHDTDTRNSQVFPVKINIDFEQNIIRFKIPKYICNNMKEGALITNTYVSASYIHAGLFNRNLLIYSLFHDTAFGNNYQIQY